MSRVRRRCVLLIALLSIAVAPGVAAQVPRLQITAVSVNPAQETLAITGWGFRVRGDQPVPLVMLGVAGGVLRPLQVVSATNTSVTARLTSAQAGSYRLFVAPRTSLRDSDINFNSASDAASFDVTIGVAGPAGPIGPMGPMGPLGQQGAQGIQGATGAIGATGPTGVAGLQGPQGLQGPEGLIGAQGPSGERGEAGARGDTGAGGDTGEIGPRGETGARGETGGTGARGDTGASGDTGAIGPQGLQGATGGTGAAGSRGPTGEAGAAGALGPQGLQGVAGAIGPVGPQGTPGLQGVAGGIGSVGPQGPGGEQGLAGAAGQQGSPGTPGLQGTPGANGATGADGRDGLQGTPGTPGATGPQGVPGPEGAAGVGLTNRGGWAPVAYLPGEYAFDRATAAADLLSMWIYRGTGTSGVDVRPFASDQWVEFSAPRGPQGLQGPQGFMGPGGPQGVPGLQGAAGALGAPGPQGARGLQGLQAEPGPAGAQGAQGLQGIPGTPGAAGPQGVPGLQGTAGAAGTPGPQGVAGSQGPMGPQGLAGQPGTGLTNRGTWVVNPATAYAISDFVFDRSTSDENVTSLWVLRGEGIASVTTQPFLSDQWVEFTAPAGPQGATGATGPMGVAGAIGPQGNVGFQGAAGPQGPAGPPGTDGPTGPMGPAGPQGVRGANGVDGANGAPGAQGPGGTQGAIGPQGLRGDAGAPGPQGAQGERGAVGPQGVAGPTGATGGIGSIGPAGLQGVIGDEGAQGPAGAPGPRGFGLDHIGRTAIVSIGGSLAANGTYSSPLDALDALASWCPLPADSDHCLLKIMPGSHSLGGRALILPAYVDLEGSGEATTELVGTSGATPEGSTLIFTAGNNTVRNLTLRLVHGSLGSGIAIDAAAAQATVEHVTVRTPSTSSSGVSVFSTESGAVAARLDYITVTGGGWHAFSLSAAATVSHASVQMEPPNVYGFRVTADVTLRDVSVDGANIGIQLDLRTASVLLRIEDSVIRGRMRALRMEGGTTAEINASQLKLDGAPTTESIAWIGTAPDGSLQIGGSMIHGGVAGPGACVGSYNSVYAPLDAFCVQP